MLVNSITCCYIPHYSIRNSVSCKGVKEEVISEGFREFVSEALPFYKAGRTLYKIGEGDGKGAVKQGIGFVDNTLGQPLKQGVALSVAAKAAAIGTAICPGIGTAILGGAGYLATLMGWGYVRNKAVDAVMDD